MTRVLPATEADIPGWLELAAEVGELFGADMTNDPGFLDTLKRNVARGSALCVRSGGAVAGAMLFRDASINWLAVRSAHRRRGVGRALVAHAIASGGREVRVTTFGEGHRHPDSGAARVLYRSMGFVPSDEDAGVSPDGTPREVLVWRRA